MLPTMFEPKFQHRWIATFDGLDAFLMNSIDYSPLIPTDKHFVMKPKGLAVMELHCSIAPSAEQQVFETAYEQFSRPLGDCTIKYLDPVGTVVSQHILTNPRIVQLEFTPACYDKKETVKMLVSFEYEEFVLDF